MQIADHIADCLLRRTNSTLHQPHLHAAAACAGCDSSALSANQHCRMQRLHFSLFSTMFIAFPPSLLRNLEILRTSFRDLLCLFLRSQPSICLSIYLSLRPVPSNPLHPFPHPRFVSVASHRLCTTHENFVHPSWFTSHHKTPSRVQFRCI